MKNHPIKKIKFWPRVILILSMYLTACSAYHAFSASRYTSSTPDQKSDDQLDIPDFDFSRRSSLSPCPSFMSLSSRNMYSPSPFPLHSSFSMSLSSRNLYSPSPCPLNSPPFFSFSRDLAHGVVTDSVKKEWFEAVTKGDLPALQDIISNYIFDVDEVCQKGNTAFLMACERQNKRIATYLLSIGAHKFVRNNDGRDGFSSRLYPWS